MFDMPWLKWIVIGGCGLLVVQNVIAILRDGFRCWLYASLRFDAEVLRLVGWLLLVFAVCVAVYWS